MKYIVYYKNGHITQFEGNYKSIKTETDYQIIGENKTYIIPVGIIDKVVEE